MDLAEEFHGHISRVVDEKGVYPFPGMSKDRDGKLTIAALCETDTAFRWFWHQIANEQAVECIFGLDRSTLPDQGTEFSDVLTCVHWAEGLDGKPWDTSFRIGVINYQNEPRIVRPFDFANKFWTERMTREVRSFRPLHRIVLSK